MDFTISGHVNRALFVNNSDGGTKAQVKDNGGSGTRVRANGSSELMDGSTVGIQLEYALDSDVSLRHANIQYGGGFGRVTLGQGSEAGDGSAYSDTTGVFGIGHGADTGVGFGLDGYFGSLDAGARVNMVRYDTPTIGMLSGAVSVAKHDGKDRMSGLVKVATDFGGTSVGAKLATLQQQGDQTTLGASFGATLASGLTVSGAWASGKGMDGSIPIPALLTPFVGEDPPDIVDVDECPNKELGNVGLCSPRPGGGYTFVPHEKLEVPIEPTYFQAEIGYKFGNTGVAVSWYSSADFLSPGSAGTAIGAGVRHTMPKVGAEVYAAVQNYTVDDLLAITDVKDVNGKPRVALNPLVETNEMVFMVGTRVKF